MLGLQFVALPAGGDGKHRRYFAMDQKNDPETLRLWDDIDPLEQTDLREAFGHYQDGLPLTCSMETKVERFRQWLRERGVLWMGAAR